MVLCHNSPNKLIQIGLDMGSFKSGPGDSNVPGLIFTTIKTKKYMAGITWVENTVKIRLEAMQI